MDKEVLRAIEDAKLKYIDAIRRGDASAMTELFADDAVLLPPASEIAQGKIAVSKFCKEQLQGGLKDEDVTSIEVSGSCDIVYEISTYTAEFGEKGGKQEVKGKYMGIWKQTKSGWKVHRLVWNLNGPSKE